MQISTVSIWSRNTDELVCSEAGAVYKRWALEFVDDFVIPENLHRAAVGSVKMFNGPMHEDALERLGICLNNGLVLLSVLQRPQRRAQQRRVREIRMVIGEGAELDLGLMVPEDFGASQTQKEPLFHRGLVEG